MSDRTIDDLVARLRRLEDEAAVQATLYAYGAALDYGDRDQFLRCFTPDAHYEVLRRPHPRPRGVAQARHDQPVRHGPR
jgi:hypothetical protein